MLLKKKRESLQKKRRDNFPKLNASPVSHYRLQSKYGREGNRKKVFLLGGNNDGFMSS